jgi:hypothetical protein
MRRMNHFAAVAALTTVCNAVAAHGVAADEVSVGGLAQVAIIDRANGVELIPHFYGGEYWVAGKPGATYSIAIRNRLGERLLAVASVDGVNVISGATAAWDQTGYVFGANQRYEITGWRKSDLEVAAFTFTESPNSYAERTGRPANVGVIGVALFRERQPEPVYAPPMQASAPKLGTGHGERQFSYVSHTEFSRLQPEPNEVIRIRYDSFDNLVAMGVIEHPRPATPTTNPVPGSPARQYVPDPPGTNAGAR